LNICEMIEEADQSADIKQNSKSGWFKVDGYCTFFNNDDSKPMYYLACKTCKKKVLDEPSGYRCENCGKSYNEAVPTYNFAFMFSDYTGKVTVQCLGEVGDSILGCTAATFVEDT